MDKSSYLSEHTIFRDLNARELNNVNARLTLLAYSSRKIFFTPGDESKAIFFLFDGKVHLYQISPRGHKLILAIIRPGGCFGEAALARRRTYHAYAQTMEGCKVGVMYRADFVSLMREQPQVGIRYAEVLGKRLIQGESYLAEATFNTLSTRLARLLLRSVDEMGQQGEVRGLRHQDFGEMLGSHRETVTETLNEFKADGLIEIGRKCITLLDRGGLEMMARG